MFRLIIGNLRHKKIRTLLTLIGLALATGTLFSLLAFKRGYERALERELEGLGAHILVVPKGCPYDAASLALHGANWPCYLKESYLAQVSQTPGVAVAAPALMAASHTKDREIVVGITSVYLQVRPRVFFQLWRSACRRITNHATAHFSGTVEQGVYPRQPGGARAGSGFVRHE